jgi:alkanesulfonate monooxygenase SsuD/methylene tetrahydromethanopterin reductase-like flavin-dependent oxidoreductase (luciferase family)
MEFGLQSWAVADVDFIAHAERLGYDYCWASDSPMLRSNPWAALALIAQGTRTMRLGPGVAVPGLRSAPDTANAIATINQLAPGRVFLGLGTGNTAMRTLGQKPMRLKPFAEYIRVVRGLLSGEEVRYSQGSESHVIRFQNAKRGVYDIDHEVPIHVGGFGPKAQALAGELGDGLITGLPRGGTIAQALANVRHGAAAVGRSLDRFYTSALVNMVLLESGERLSSERVLSQVGSAIMANVHYLVDQFQDNGKAPPDAVLPIWDDYLVFHQRRGLDRRHQKLNESHYTYLDVDEAPFVTPEIIKAFCIAGTADEVIEQLHALEAAGLDGISFIPPDGERHRMYEAFAKNVIAGMR